MMDSGNNIGSRDPTWKYCTHVEGNRNGTICNYCGLVIKSGEITHFKFHLSHSYLHSNTKKCPNVHPEVKQEMRQLLDQKNKAKAKKTTNIKEIRTELRGIMGGRHRHLIDEDEEEEEDDVYMYPSDMTLMRELNFEQHVVHQNLLNGIGNKKKNLRETKEKCVNL